MSQRKWEVVVRFARSGRPRGIGMLCVYDVVMRCAFLVLMVAAFCLPAADKKPKGRKLPDLETLELKVRRTEGKVTLDGRVRNSGEKTLSGVVVIFDFLAPGKVPVTTQKTTVDEETLEPGKEAAFHAEMVDPVRAVECVMSAAEDEGGRDLRLARIVRVNIE